jgi:hypothetical protein
MKPWMKYLIPIAVAVLAALTELLKIAAASS